MKAYSFAKIKSGYWKRELGEDPHKAIQSFLDEGLLVHADFEANYQPIINISVRR